MGLPTGSFAFMLHAGAFLVMAVVWMYLKVNVWQSMYHSTGGDKQPVISELKFQTIGLTMIAFPFWLWATFNIISQKIFDLGILSFLSVVLAAANGSVCSVPNNTPQLRYYLLCTSCLFVAINFGTTGIFKTVTSSSFSWAKDTVLLVYYSVAIFLWVVACVWVVLVGRRQVSAFSSQRQPNFLRPGRPELVQL
mmetsp:Transcript_16910/g.33034  ORF Transcript_16910/g.33034 Transcript_16910/m.33034 type:complete len:194 (+) Transcript_16910:117-698(+)